MFVTQKSQYGLRAVFELAKRFGEGPVKIADIARVQAIPPRFLEAILSQLKQASVVDSRRGSQGGYMLLRAPDDLSVDEVLEILQGPLSPISCTTEIEDRESECPLFGSCVFLPMWDEVRDAIHEIYQTKTFQVLLDDEARAYAAYVPQYSI